MPSFPDTSVSGRFTVKPIYFAGSRLNSALAHRNPAIEMAAHQAMLMIALLPIGVPIRSPRIVSMTGVKGWYSANQRSAVGIESVGTNALPKNGSRIRGMGMLLAVSTLSLTRPSATVSQVIAQETIASTPMAATHSRGPAVGRQPTSSATPVTTAMAIAVWIMAPRTWPVSTEAREDRKSVV